MHEVFMEGISELHFSDERWRLLLLRKCSQGEYLTMAELFEKGQSYIFYFYYGRKMGFQEISGQVVAYEHPFVKVETKGLIRIINCSSNFFVEAISRIQSEEVEELVLEKDSQ